MAASGHGDTPSPDEPGTAGSVTPYTTSVDVNGKKASGGALAVIHLTNQRSAHVPIRGSRTSHAGCNAPQAMYSQGAMSHTGTAGLPNPENVAARTH
jgi:hypothetical protein